MPPLDPASWETNRHRLLGQIICTALDGAPYLLRPIKPAFGVGDTLPDPLDPALRRTFKALAKAADDNGFINPPGLALGLRVLAASRPGQDDFVRHLIESADDIETGQTAAWSRPLSQQIGRTLTKGLTDLARTLKAAGAVDRFFPTFDPKRPAPPRTKIQASYELCMVALAAAQLIGAGKNDVEHLAELVAETIAYLAAREGGAPVRQSVIRLSDLAAHVQAQEDQANVVIIDDFAAV